MAASEPSARHARLIFILGMVGAALVTASACSLTNLGPYTSGGDGVDTGGTSAGDSTIDGRTDARADSSTRTDDGADTGGDDSTIDDSRIDSSRDATVADARDATPDAVDAPDGTLDVSDVIDATDAAVASDTAMDADATDSAVDATTTDSTPVVDTFDATPADVGVDPDAPCGSGVGRFGFSEVMPRAVSGSGDKHEWIEVTNYDSCPINVSGVTLKIFSTVERASFTFPTGTTLLAGEALIVADDSAIFAGDVAAAGDAGVVAIGKVFSFGSTTGDVIVNGTATFKLFAPGATVPYEDVTASSPSAGWQANRSVAYPVPSATCPVSGRYSTPTGGTLSAAWKQTPIDPAQKYGETGTPAVSLYGSPTKPNTGISCP